MNTKELIEAAITLRDCGELCRSTQDDLCHYILATVRPDDDEPVTRERLEADGWASDRERLTWKHGAFTVDFTSGDNPRALFWVVGLASTFLKSMGHLRRLVAALGE